MTEDPKNDVLQSIRRHQRIGFLVTALLAGGVGSWAATTEIGGAVIAPGALVIESDVKKVQHPTGGVVGKILVRDGEYVRAGELVLRLDDTLACASLAIVTKGQGQGATKMFSHGQDPLRTSLSGKSRGTLRVFINQLSC